MIQRIEEMLMNSFPALNVMIENGFLIRLYNTREICSINKIEKDIFDMSNAIRLQEKKLRSLGIDPCYRILHEKSYESLDVELLRNGYDVIYRGVVMGLNIKDMQRELFRFANFYEQGIFADDNIGTAWFDDYKYLKNMDENYSDILFRNINNSLEKIVSFVLVKETRLIAMAYATIIDNYIIINDIYVDERYRDLDYGKKILKAILTKGLQKNCDTVICDLRESENIALNMLQKEGFKKLYSYQYRGKKI